MKFKKLSSLIERELNKSHGLGILHLSMDSKEFKILMKKDKELEIIPDCFPVLWGDDFFPYNKDNEDFISIDKKGWNKFLSEIQ